MNILVQARIGCSNKVIKQADVVTMLNLFKDRYSKKSRKQIGNITSLAPNMVQVLVLAPMQW